jgi:hypothetical protein
MASWLAQARPGGGGGFHGGGSGGFHGGSHSFSGGGFHSSGLGGGAMFTLPSSCLVTVLVLILVGALLLNIWRRSRQPAAPAQPRPAAPHVVPANLDALRQQDPGLSAQGLEARTRRMADILREAWCAGDMRPARAFVSDGVFCRFSVQLELMRAHGERNVMADAAVDAVTIVGAERADPFEFVRVRVDAHARDLMVPYAATAEQVAKALHGAANEPYSEIWSLVRCQGAKTKPEHGHVGISCPSCGAPLGEGEVIQCRYCHALVNSGEFDWVLAEITQLSVWRPAALKEVPGFSRLHAADPGLAVAAMEDRASSLFWKWIEAGAKGSPAPLRKCSTTAFRNAIPAPPALHEVAVGGVDLVACGAAGEPGGMDQAEVKVRWSGAARPGEEGRYLEHVLRLVRRAGVQSKPSFSSLVCHACGAPLTASDSDQCDHCHAEVATGEQSWVLDGVLAGRPDW